MKSFRLTATLAVMSSIKVSFLGGGLSILLAIVCALPLAAQPEQPVQGLFLSQVPYLQNKGEAQVTITRLNGRSHLEHQSQLGIEWGLSSRWQVELEAVGRRAPAGSGADSHTSIVSAGAAVDRGFVSQDETFRYTIGASAEAAMGRLSSDQSRISIGPSFSVMKDVTAMHGLRVLASGSASIGLFARQSSGTDAPEYEMQLGAFIPISVARVSAELSHSSAAGDDGAGRAQIGAAGIVIPLPQGFEFGAAALMSLNNKPHSFLFKLAYEF